MSQWRKAACLSLLWLGLLIVLLAGAWLAGVLFQAGKAFAEVSQGRRIHDSLNGLAAWCAHTDFAGYLRPGLMLAAILAWVPARECHRRFGMFQNPALPKDCARAVAGWGGRTCWAALLLAANAGCLLAAQRWPGADPSRCGAESAGFWFWACAVLTSLAAAVTMELVFRGGLFRAFQQVAGPQAAWWQSSLAFACFLYLSPSSSWPVQDPDEGGSGFSLLAIWCLRLSHPAVFFGEFLPVLLWGLLLGWTRLRSNRISLALALQCGYLLGGLPIRFLAGGQSLLPPAEIRGAFAILHPLLACICVFALWKWLERSCSQAGQPAVAPPPVSSHADETIT